MKKKIIGLVLIFCVGIGQLIAQDTKFRYASTTLTHQVLDSIITTGIAGPGVPIYNYYSLGQVIKSKFTRDASGNTIEQKDFYINSSTLILDPITKYTHSYDANDLMSVTITARWDKTGNQFIDSLRTEYEYPLNDISIQNIYKKIAASWVLIDSVKTVTTYNANQDPTEKITYASLGGLWVDSLKETNTYDVSNRLKTKIISLYNGSAYVDVTKSTITYGASTGTLVLEDWNGTAWVTKTYSATVSGTTYNVAATTTVYHSTVSKTTLPVIENAIDAVKTYPNPTVEGFYVNAGDNTVRVQVISVKGELLIEREVKGTEYIRVDRIGKGTFLVKISSNDGKTITKKLYVK